MPAQRVRHARGVTERASHPYKLRPARKYTRENMAQDQPAENLKYQKASQEQALRILDHKELRNIPVQQLRRLAGVCSCMVQASLLNIDICSLLRSRKSRDGENRASCYLSKESTGLAFPCIPVRVESK